MRKGPLFPSILPPSHRSFVLFGGGGGAISIPLAEEEREREGWSLAENEQTSDRRCTCGGVGEKEKMMEIFFLSLFPRVKRDTGRRRRGRLVRESPRWVISYNKMEISEMGSLANTGAREIFLRRRRRRSCHYGQREAKAMSENREGKKTKEERSGGDGEGRCERFISLPFLSYFEPPHFPLLVSSSSLSPSDLSDHLCKATEWEQKRRGGEGGFLRKFSLTFSEGKNAVVTLTLTAAAAKSDCLRSPTHKERTGGEGNKVTKLFPHL